MVKGGENNTAEGTLLEVRYGTVRYGTVRYGTVRYGTVIPPKEKVVRMVCLRWIYDEMRFCSIFIKPIC